MKGAEYGVPLLVLVGSPVQLFGRTSLIERHATRWDWKVLSANESLPWSMEMIKQYSDLWSLKTVSKNRGVYKKVFSDHISPQLIHRVLDS